MVATSDIRTTPVELTENARTILERRYLLRGSDGELRETPEELRAISQRTPLDAHTTITKMVDGLLSIRSPSQTRPSPHRGSRSSPIGPRNPRPHPFRCVCKLRRFGEVPRLGTNQS